MGLDSKQNSWDPAVDLSKKFPAFSQNNKHVSQAKRSRESRIAAFLIGYSGGVVKNEKQVHYVYIAIIVVSVLFTIWFSAVQNVSDINKRATEQSLKLSTQPQFLPESVR
jgi:hypothetical protein